MTNKREIRITGELRVAPSDTESPKKLVGTIPYNQRSSDLGGFFEVIAPGAFASSVNGDVVALRDHDPKILLGRTKAGTMSLQDMADGLHYEILLPNTTQANDLVESVGRGDLDSTSFGFYCKQDAWSNNDGQVLRTLLDVELFEISPCSFAAYPTSTAGLRSLFPDGMPEGMDKPATEQCDMNQCECPCPECMAGDCVNCSDPDCSYDMCDCNEMVQMRMKLTLAEAL